MLIGILVWINVLERAYISHATTPLSRFMACLREGHITWMLSVFSYLKKRPNRRFIIDSWYPLIVGKSEGIDNDLTAQLGDNYPDASEEVD